MNSCPRCKSTRIEIRYPNVKCLDCHYSEPLTDYPVSWDCHRSLCAEYGRADPGPIELPPIIQPTNDRVDKLQSTVNTLMGREVYRQNIRRKQSPQQLQRIGEIEKARAFKNVI